MNSDTPSMLFEIADTFGMEITRRRGAAAGMLSGSLRSAWSVMQGFDWQQEVKIADSGFYEGNEKAGVVVHVAGALYLLLLIDNTKQDADYAQLWVIDGIKLGWNWRASSTLLVFPASWNRAMLYATVQEGVVAGFRRSRKAVRWEPVANAKQAMRERVAGSQKDDTATETDAEKIVKKLRADTASISDRFRTTGPRGV